MTGALIHVARPLGIIALSFLISALTMPGLIRLLKYFKMGKSIRDAESAPAVSYTHLTLPTKA